MDIDYWYYHPTIFVALDSRRTSLGAALFLQDKYIVMM